MHSPSFGAKLCKGYPFYVLPLFSSPSPFNFFCQVAFSFSLGVLAFIYLYGKSSWFSLRLSCIQGSHFLLSLNQESSSIKAIKDLGELARPGKGVGLGNSRCHVYGLYFLERRFRTETRDNDRGQHKRMPPPPKKALYLCVYILHMYMSTFYFCAYAFLLVVCLHACLLSDWALSFALEWPDKHRVY